MNHPITLHIERLILDGISLSPYERQVLETAVSAELTRLLTAEGLGSSFLTGGAVPLVPAGAFQLSAKPNPAQLGTQIAQAVYQGIGKA